MNEAQQLLAVPTVTRRMPQRMSKDRELDYRQANRARIIDANLRHILMTASALDESWT